MKCLVTGSEGFIGRNLVARLEQDGHEVLPYDLKTDKWEYWAKIAWDKPQVDVIFHLACMNQMQATRHSLENMKVNAWGTSCIANYAASQGAKLVYTSTASVYGNAKVIPTPVTAELNPLTDYAVAKLAGEYFVKNSGADYTILRLSNVYGPHQTLDNPYCGVIGRFFEQAMSSEPLTVIGNGLQTRDFSFVDDVVEHLMSAAIGRSFRGRVFNVSRGREVPIIQLAEYITSLVGNGSKIQLIEERVIDGVKRRCLVPDLKCPTSLDQGLRKTYEWFSDHK